VQKRTEPLNAHVRPLYVVLSGNHKFFVKRKSSYYINRTIQFLPLTKWPGCRFVSSFVLIREYRSQIQYCWNKRSYSSWASYTEM